MKIPAHISRLTGAGVLFCLLLTGCFSGLPAAGPTALPLENPAAPEETTTAPDGGPLVLVHYMPWYRGPSSKAQENHVSSYGGHWTGWGTINPAQTSGGKAPIYSHQYPLTGPYHGGNPALLEYQAALMKLSGIDGVIFDWYGSYAANDFGEIHEYTQAMAVVLKRAGLKFLVCYEDNTLNMMGKSGGEAAAIGKEVFYWAQKNWFADSSYVHYEGRPVVMCFGPQHFKTKEAWDAVFIGADPKPWFVDLDNKYPWADASFNWPPMWASAGGVLSVSRLEQYLDDFYGGRQRDKPYRVATVFSAFDDCYEDTGGTSYGTLEYNSGTVFDITFKKAMPFNPHIVQAATWNDYGEGTIIEPTIERGYSELEYLQDREKEWNEDFPYNKTDLRYPLEFYKLLYADTASAGQRTAICAAINALFAGSAEDFRAEAVKTGVTVEVNDLKPLLRD